MGVVQLGGTVRFPDFQTLGVDLVHQRGVHIDDGDLVMAAEIRAEQAAHGAGTEHCNFHNGDSPFILFDLFYSRTRTGRPGSFRRQSRASDKILGPALTAGLQDRLHLVVLPHQRHTGVLVAAGAQRLHQCGVGTDDAPQHRPVLVETVQPV